MHPRASFWQRAAAWSLDATLLAVPTLLLTWPSIAAGLAAMQAAGAALVTGTNQVAVAAAHGADPMALMQSPDAAGLVQASATVEAAAWQLLLPPLLTFALLGGIYHVAAECSRWRGSLGKRWLDLHVGDARGARLEWPQSAWRYLAGSLSWLTLNLGHAMALRPGRRALHDRLSHTRVSSLGEARLPEWARAWLWLQGGVLVLATLWLVARLYAAMQALMEQALGL